MAQMTGNTDRGVTHEPLAQCITRNNQQINKNCNEKEIKQNNETS